MQHLSSKFVQCAAEAVPGCFSCSPLGGAMGRMLQTTVLTGFRSIMNANNKTNFKTELDYIAVLTISRKTKRGRALMPHSS